jgi:hypothetical protein
MPTKESLKAYNSYNVKTERSESHCNFVTLPPLPFWKQLSDYSRMRE